MKTCLDCKVLPPHSIQLCALHAAAEEMREALGAIADALDVPRNRFGKLTFHPGVDSGEPLRRLAVKYGTTGSQDAPEQAVKVARALLELIDLVG